MEADTASGCCFVFFPLCTFFSRLILRFLKLKRKLRPVKERISFYISYTWRPLFTFCHWLGLHQRIPFLLVHPHLSAPSVGNFTHSGTSVGHGSVAVVVPPWGPRFPSAPRPLTPLFLLLPLPSRHRLFLPSLELSLRSSELFILVYRVRDSYSFLVEIALVFKLIKRRKGLWGTQAHVGAKLRTCVLKVLIFRTSLLFQNMPYKQTRYLSLFWMHVYAPYYTGVSFGYCCWGPES